jgi:integrase
MPRPRHPYWVEKDRAYYTKVDGRAVMLRHATGAKVAHNDAKGVRVATDRLVAEHDASIRRAADPSVLDVCRDYLIASSRENTDETTYGKEWVLKQLCAFQGYGERPAREIVVADLARMRKAWEKDGYSPGMIRRLYSEVLACWAWAARPVEDRVPVVLLQGNPLEGLRLPPGGPRKARYLPLARLDELAAFAVARAPGLGPLRSRFELNAVLMLRFLAETGARPKEACEATWESFDADAGMVVLAKHKTARKTGRARTIVVPPSIVTELVELKASGYAHPTHLFAHPRSRGADPSARRETGQPWSRVGYAEWFRKLVKAARGAGIGLPAGLSLYWLRHSFQTDAFQAGLGGDAAADLAGNTKEIARGTYHHAQNEYLREMHDKVAARRRPGNNAG